MPIRQRRGVWIWAISLIAVAFGLLTIKEGGTILFGNEAARIAAGNYVPAVLWFNFAAGFAYVAAAAGFWMQQRWAVWLAVGVAMATGIVFAVFVAHVSSGGAYEPRTVVAMSLRTLVWVVIAVVAWRKLQRRPALVDHRSDTP